MNNNFGKSATILIFVENEFHIIPFNYCFHLPSNYSINKWNVTFYHDRDSFLFNRLSIPLVILKQEEIHCKTNLSKTFCSPINNFTNGIQNKKNMIKLITTDFGPNARSFGSIILVRKIQNKIFLLKKHQTKNKFQAISNLWWCKFMQKVRKFYASIFYKTNKKSHIWSISNPLWLKNRKQDFF